MSTSGYLPHLLGPVGFQVDGVESDVERRETVNLVGATVTDDPDNDRTNITFTGLALGTGIGTWLTTPSSANLLAALTDETGTGALVFGTAPLFKTTVNVNNPANTFKYVITPAAIAADRVLTLPLLSTSDTLVAESHTQELTNKTINATQNTITDASAAQGDLLYHNGTKFVRLARGTNGHMLYATAGSIQWAAAPAGGSTPTGNFLYKVTAGVMDAASVQVTDSLVAAAAAIAGTKIAPDFGSQDVITTGVVKIGATPASAGDIRLKNACFVRVRNAANSADLTAFQIDASNQMFIACRYAGGFAERVDYAYIHPSLGGYLMVAGADALAWSSAGVQSYYPIKGLASPYAVHGLAAQAMADANQTPAAAVYSCNTITPTGALTANRTLTLPTATDANAYTKWIDNLCTGAFGITVTTGAGTTVYVPNGKKARIEVRNAGVKEMTHDTANCAGTVWASNSSQVSSAYANGVRYVPLLDANSDYVEFQFVATFTGTVRLDVLYAMSSALANGVRMRLDWVKLASGDNPTTAVTTGTAFTVTPAATTDVHTIDTTNSADFALAVVAGQTVYFKLYRLGTDGADTHTGDQRIIEIRVK